MRQAPGVAEPSDLTKQLPPTGTAFRPALGEMRVKAVRCGRLWRHGAAVRQRLRRDPLRHSPPAAAGLARDNADAVPRGPQRLDLVEAGLPRQPLAVPDKLSLLGDFGVGMPTDHGHWELSWGRQDCRGNCGSAPHWRLAELPFNGLPTVLQQLKPTSDLPHLWCTIPRAP